MHPTNLALLTQSHNAIAAKKNARRGQVKEVIFDDDARREFLTGFHKRKKAKADAARKRAQERAKEEHLESRREARQALREQAKENAAQVEKAYAEILGPAVDDESDDDFGGEWQGIGSSSGIEKGAEYEGEEVLATVTVVEDFDPSTLTTAEPTPARQETSEELSQPGRSYHPPPSHGNPAPKKRSKPKVREKKIRYETKAADKHRRDKQHMRKREKAALAGGKASRQRKSKR